MMYILKKHNGEEKGAASRHETAEEGNLKRFTLAPLQLEFRLTTRSISAF